MATTTVVAITLIAYKLLLIGIGFWARSRNTTDEEFFLGGRGLGPLVAAISYSSSASSAWTLLGISGAAYVMGVSVIWTALGSVIGMIVAWFWAAPKLLAYTRRERHLTFTDFLVHGATGSTRRRLVITASAITIFSFVFYIAAQFQGAGNTFSSAFGLSMPGSIVLGASIIMIYTLLGGFWAVSVTDTVQGLLMMLTAILLPLALLTELGGLGAFLSGLQEVSSPQQLSFTATNAGLVALGVIFGGMGISLGTFGQPQLMVRFMALRDDRALRQARLITIVWYLTVFTGMCFLGLGGHILNQSVDNPETIFFVLTESLFAPVLGAVLLAAVLSAIMSTADSQLLVAASAIAHDLGLGHKGLADSLLISRLTIVGLVVLAVLVSIYLPEKIFSRVLFAWMALGAAFGPTLFFRLAGQQLRHGGVLLAMVVGFSLSVMLYLFPNAPGDSLERLLPFCVGLGILVLARQGSQPPAATRRPD